MTTIEFSTRLVSSVLCLQIEIKLNNDILYNADVILYFVAGSSKTEHPVVAADDKKTEKITSGGNKFGLGMFGKNKKKAAAAAAEEEKKKQEEEKTKDKILVSRTSGALSDDEDELMDEDPEYALHNKIIQTTSNLQAKGAGDAAYNEYMEQFKTRCVQLQTDRTAIIKRESANFLTTFEPSPDNPDPSLKVIKYGSGVDYIVHKKYLLKDAIENVD
jgi:hypothetical protein